MAISEISAALDILSKMTSLLSRIKQNYNRASEEIQDFPEKVRKYEEKRRHWEELLRKHPLPQHHVVITRLKEAVTVLEEVVKEVAAIQRSSCCCRIWSKTWSLESLVSVFAAVETAFGNISEDLWKGQQDEQNMERAGNKNIDTFSFDQDKKYVPIARTVEKVRQSLEDDNSQHTVVLLYGGSGEGKSTLAKYIALHYQKAKEGSSSSSACRFPDGIVFLPCGKKVDSLFLVQKMWVDLGYSFESFVGGLQSTDDAERGMKLDQLKRALKSKLGNGKSLLIIVDDAWEQKVIADLMLSLKGIKYLITSQLKEVWSDAVTFVQTESPSPEEARQILANHIVGWNCAPFPREVQEEADRLIKKVDKHPLVLANLGTLIECEKVPDLETWKELREKLLDYVREADRVNAVSKPTAFGEPYHRNVVASLMMAVDLVSEEARSLLFLLAICTGDGVDEIVLRLWSEALHDPNKFDFAYRELKQRSLISLTEPKSNWSRTGFVEPKKICIHDLRRKLIREMKQEALEEILQKLIGKEGARSDTELHLSSDQTEEDLNAALCFLYGDVQYRERAQTRLEIHEDFRGTFSSRDLDSIQRFLRLLQPRFDGAREWQKATHELATTVILYLLRTNDLKDETISRLLDIPEAFTLTCSAIASFDPFRGMPMTEKKLLQALKKQADGPPDLQIASNLKIQLNAFRSIHRGTIHSDFPTILRKLLQCPWSTASSSHLEAIRAILDFIFCFSKYHLVNRRAFSTTPGMLETFLRHLHSDFHSDLVFLQRSIETFVEVACRDTDIKAKTILLPDVLNFLVPLLSLTPKPALEALEELAWIPMHADRIASYPGALDKIVKLVTDSSEVQSYAIKCFGHLASFQSTLLIITSKYSHAFQTLVQLLHRDSPPTLFPFIATAVRKIVSNDIDVYFGFETSKTFLIDIFERLQLLLDENVNVRGPTVDALGILAAEDTIFRRLETFQELLEQIVSVPADINAKYMEFVNTTINRIISGNKDRREPHMMEFIAGAVKMYTRLLQGEGVEFRLQREVAEGLGLISYEREFRKIVTDAGGAQLTINHMRRDPTFYFSNTRAHILEIIIFEGGSLDCSVQISEVLEFYVAYLKDGPKIPNQESSLQVIASLAFRGEIRKLIAEDGRIQRTLLDHVSTTASSSALVSIAKIIYRVCCTELDEINKINLLAKTLERYTALLVEGTDTKVQEAATLGLVILIVRKEIQRQILADEEILNLFSRLLTEHVTCKTLHCASYLLQNILLKGSEPEESRGIEILDRAVSSLVALSTEGRPIKVQAAAIGCLGRLAFMEENGEFRVAHPRAVNELIQVLRRIEFRSMLNEFREVMEFVSACRTDIVDLQKILLGLEHYALQCYISVMQNEAEFEERDIAANCLVRLLLYEPNRKIFTSACPTGLICLRRLAGVAATNVRAMVALTLIDPTGVENLDLSSVDALCAVADARIVLKQHKIALENYDRAIKLNPHDGTILSRRGYVKAQLEDMAGALEDLNQAIFLSNRWRGTPGAFNLQERGILKSIMQDYGGALSDLNESLRTYPDDYEVLKHRGYVKFRSGDEEGARFDAQQAICTKAVEGPKLLFPQCFGGSAVKYLEFQLP